MSSTCLLTDGSAQYSSSAFRGKEHIYSIVPDIFLNEKTYHECQNVDIEDFPANSFLPSSPRLVVPDLAQVCARISLLADRYDYLIAILSARCVNPLFGVIEKAVLTSCGKVKGQVINSRAISAGLGFLLEKAAGAVVDGLKPPEIERLIRRQIPHVYSAVSTSGWSYLHRSKLVDHAQAEIGEMLGLWPVFTLEDGGLSPVQKVKSDHSIFEYFQEFLDEFVDLERISFLYHPRTSKQDDDLLREHVKETYHQTIYSQIPLNPENAMIFGPYTLGLTVVEKTDA